MLLLSDIKFPDKNVSIRTNKRNVNTIYKNSLSMFKFLENDFMDEISVSSVSSLNGDMVSLCRYSREYHLSAILNKYGGSRRYISLPPPQVLQKKILLYNKMRSFEHKYIV